MVKRPHDADTALLEGLSNDTFDILPADIGNSLQYAAHCFAYYGECDVTINGVAIDYQTLLVQARRFANDEALRNRANAVLVNGRRFEILYRR
jgi:hypothetical protein